MRRETALTWSWLNVLTKKRYDALMEVFGCLDKALKNFNGDLLKSLGCRSETVSRVLSRLERFDAGVYEKELQERSVEFLSIEDPSYPDLLAQVGDPPIFLYYRGDLSILENPCLAIVGTRNMSSYGKRVTEEFVPAFVSAGLVTVSGLAQGIDAQVARETLMASGKTVAVLGHGLSEIFPKCNTNLAEQVVESGGLLLSEFPLDVAPDKYTFPARNRIIAGLALGTVVLEAGEGSGALITADLALDYSREVFAVPGQIFDEHYAGCNKEIARGHARLVSAPGEILREIGIIAPEHPKIIYIPQNESEEAVFTVLTTMPQSVDELINRCKLKAAPLNTTLTMLELRGVVKNVGGGKWVCC